MTVASSIIIRIDMLTYAWDPLHSRPSHWRLNWRIERERPPGRRTRPVAERVVAETQGKLRIGTAADLPWLRWIRAEQEAAVEREKYLQSKAIDARAARLLGSGAKDGAVEPRMTPQQEERLRWIDPNDVAKLTERLVDHPDIVDLLIQASPSLRDDGEGGSGSAHANGEPYDKEVIKNILSNVLVEDSKGRRPARDAATALEPPADSGETRGDRDVVDAIARAFGATGARHPSRCRPGG
jgi:hypothetical protein